MYFSVTSYASEILDHTNAYLKCIDFRVLKLIAMKVLPES